MSLETLKLSERRATISLALVMGLRMLGLFLILPIFALFARTLQHATPALIGIALGVYGLTQALLQIPFGALSDRFGRKPIITLGLTIFILGSLVCANSHSIYGVIIGRAMQGASAVGSALLALVADSTREEIRTHAMAMIGMTIGMAFSTAIFLGPFLIGFFSAATLFYVCAGLALGAMISLWGLVPNPKKSVFHRDTEPVPALFKSIIRNKELMRLNFGVFALHAMLTAMFLALPVVLAQVTQIPQAKQWHLFLPALLAAFVAVVPFIIIGEKKRLLKPILISAVVLLMLINFSFIVGWAMHAEHYHKPTEAQDAAEKE